VWGKVWAVIVGVLGFIVAYLFDWVSMKRILGGKQAIAFSVVLLYAVPIRVVMGVLHVAVQDRFFFPKVFPDYPRYQRWTPMLIPTKRSMAACLRTLKAREA